MWKLLLVLLPFLIGVNQAKQSCASFSTRWFPCRNGGCVPISYVCQWATGDLCGDQSTELVCGPDCPKLFYQCADKSGCYNYSNHCDGKYDCADFSDEKDCWAMVCAEGQTRCLDGTCAVSRDNCCATREGICVEPHFDAPRKMMKKTLVYADGGNLYHLNLADNSTRRLHTHDSRVLALTYDVGTDMLYWIDEKSIWNMTLTATGGKARLFGRLEPNCHATAMAHDWITGNFYIACKHSGLIICHSRVGITRMLCSSPILAAFGSFNWIALDPSSGRMLLGRINSSEIVILKAESDGSNPKEIYKTKTHISFGRVGIYMFRPSWNKDEEMFVLRTDGRGTLLSVNLLDGVEKQVTHNIVGPEARAVALFHDVAIMEQFDKTYALFFWKGRTVVTQKELNFSIRDEPLTLIDTNAQPMSENRCDNLNCDHLCLLVPDGAVCECSAGYLLMDDGQTCASEQSSKPETEVDRSGLQSGVCELNRVMIVAILAVSVSSLAVHFFFIILFSRGNSNRPHGVRPEATTSVNPLYEVHDSMSAMPTHRRLEDASRNDLPLQTINS